MTLTVELLLYGLMVLASGNDGMKVLLVKGETANCKHIPTLTFRYGDTACEKIEGTDIVCKAGQGLCQCDLGDIDISFDPPTEKKKGPFGGKPSAELPSSQNGEAIEWLVQMKNVDGVNQIQLKDWATIQRYVSAHIDNFGWEQATNCRFEERKQRVHNFEFIDKNDKKASNHRQALSEYAVFEGRIPVKQGDISYQLVLKKRGTREDVKIQFKCENNKCPDLFLANRPVGKGCQNEIVGEHFAHYQPLLQDSKGLRPRRLHLEVSAASQDVQPTSCELPISKIIVAAEDLESEPEAFSFEDKHTVHIMTVHGPVICPMVMVSQ